MLLTVEEIWAKMCSFNRFSYFYKKRVVHYLFFFQKMHVSNQFIPQNITRIWRNSSNELFKILVFVNNI